jgi:hypothetical protein
MPDINNLREEGFVLAHSFNGFSSSWQGRHGRAQKFSSWHPGK